MCDWQVAQLVGKLLCISPYFEDDHRVYDKDEPSDDKYWRACQLRSQHVCFCTGVDSQSQFQYPFHMEADLCVRLTPLMLHEPQLHGLRSDVLPASEQVKRLQKGAWKRAGNEAKLFTMKDILDERDGLLLMACVRDVNILEDFDAELTTDLNDESVQARLVTAFNHAQAARTQALHTVSAHPGGAHPGVCAWLAVLPRRICGATW